MNQFDQYSSNGTGEIEIGLLGSGWHTAIKMFCGITFTNKFAGALCGLEKIGQV